MGQITESAKEARKEPNMKLVAFADVANSFFRTNMILALQKAEKGFAFRELFGASLASSEGTFAYHVRELQRLGLITLSNPYKLTDLGKEIAKLVKSILAES